jgi:hypothetical protein
MVRLRGMQQRETSGSVELARRCRSPHRRIGGTKRRACRCSSRRSRGGAQRDERLCRPPVSARSYDEKDRSTGPSKILAGSWSREEDRAALHRRAADGKAWAPAPCVAASFGSATRSRHAPRPCPALAPEADRHFSGLLRLESPLRCRRLHVTSRHADGFTSPRSSSTCFCAQHRRWKVCACDCHLTWSASMPEH